MSTMLAAVMHVPGGAEVLKLEQHPIPTAKEGQVLIRVKAFGLNRSELFTRQGLSPASAVTLPRILGIECTGLVSSCPNGEFKEGDVVATCMGGMGRLFDGGYAEYCVVPCSQVQAITAKLDWPTLGALPEMLQTAWGSLFKSLRLKAGERLLVRGGTTSVGLAAASIAKNTGCYVAGTSRSSSSSRTEIMKSAGCDEVLLDDGELGKLFASESEGGKDKEKFDKCLELVGATSIIDSLQCVKEGGSVCMTGMVGNAWVLKEFTPMPSIPTAVNLTTYAGGPEDFKAMPLAELCEMVEQGRLSVKVGKVFKLQEIVEAHRTMEENSAGGKIVVLT